MRRKLADMWAVAYGIRDNPQIAEYFEPGGATAPIRWMHRTYLSEPVVPNIEFPYVVVSAVVGGVVLHWIQAPLTN